MRDIRSRKFIPPSEFSRAPFELRPGDKFVHDGVAYTVRAEVRGDVSNEIRAVGPNGEWALLVLSDDQRVQVIGEAA